MSPPDSFTEVLIAMRLRYSFASRAMYAMAMVGIIPAKITSVSSERYQRRGGVLFIRLILPRKKSPAQRAGHGFWHDRRLYHLATLRFYLAIIYCVERHLAPDECK